MESTSGMYVLKPRSRRIGSLEEGIEFEVGFLRQACAGLVTNYCIRPEANELELVHEGKGKEPGMRSKTVTLSLYYSM
jgi:hypothetical protein